MKHISPRLYHKFKRFQMMKKEHPTTYQHYMGFTLKHPHHSDRAYSVNYRGVNIPFSSFEFTKIGDSSYYTDEYCDNEIETFYGSIFGRHKNGGIIIFYGYHDKDAGYVQLDGFFICTDNVDSPEHNYILGDSDGFNYAKLAAEQCTARNAEETYNYNVAYSLGMKLAEAKNKLYKLSNLIINSNDTTVFNKKAVYKFASLTAQLSELRDEISTIKNDVNNEIAFNIFTPSYYVNRKNKDVIAFYAGLIDYSQGYCYHIAKSQYSAIKEG